MRYELLPSDALAPGEMRAVTAGDLPLVVIRATDGSLSALRDFCSHMGARLSRGWLNPEVVARAVGEYALGDGFVVRCPWHGFEFDARSGVCVSDAKYRARCYSVRDDDGMIVLDR